MFRSGTLCHEHEIWPLLAVTNHQVSSFTISFESIWGSNENHSDELSAHKSWEGTIIPALSFFPKILRLGEWTFLGMADPKWQGLNLRRPSVRETVPCRERTKLLAWVMQHSRARVCTLHILHILHQLSCTRVYVCTRVQMYHPPATGQQTPFTDFHTLPPAAASFFCQFLIIAGSLIKGTT